MQIEMETAKMIFLTCMIKGLVLFSVHFYLFDKQSEYDGERCKQSKRMK